MRSPFLLATAFLVASATAQNWYVPDSNPIGVACNVIPFGSTSLGTWSDQKYQTKATAADLGNAVGIVTGLGFSPGNSGSIHFDFLEIILDHHPAGATLDGTFANNLTANAVTVLSVSDYTWHATANTWNEIGLQGFFVYNGVDDVVMQITQFGAVGPGCFNRDARQRLYSTSGSTATSGSLSNAALKWEISMFMARLSMHGVSCPGTSGPAMHTLTGSAQIGGTVGLDVANGMPNGVALVAIGFMDSFPFPLDLTPQGLPGCYEYTDVSAMLATVLDGAGSGTIPLVVPNDPSFTGVKVFSQYALLDPTANAAGVTTTNYGRIYVGN